MTGTSRSPSKPTPMDYRRRHRSRLVHATLDYHHDRPQDDATALHAEWLSPAPRHALLHSHNLQMTDGPVHRSN